MGRFRLLMGRHMFKQGGRWKKVKPGDEVTCHKSELGNALKRYEILEDDPEPEIEQPVSALSLQHRSGPWFDVVNADGEKLNDKALTKAEAESMVRGEE